MRLIVLALGLCLAAVGAARPLATTYRLTPEVAPGERFMGIRLLGTLELSAQRVDGLPLVELSGLAWDADEGLLYALSDRGWLFHLRPEIDGGRLRDLTALAAYPLRDARGRRLRGKYTDSEDLATIGARNGVRGDTQLVVSFERRPRIVDYRPDGRFIRQRRLPAPLANRHAYASPNQALESVAVVPGVGIVTGPERPMRHTQAGQVVLYALDGRRWHYPLRAAPDDSLVALESLPDGSLVALERGHGSFLMLPVIISLRMIPALPSSDAWLAPRTVAVLSTSRGWSVDNFEGLAWHQGRRFFMVSDDNDRRVQRTLLVYFEILPGTRDYESQALQEFEPDQKTSH